VNVTQVRGLCDDVGHSVKQLRCRLVVQR